MCEANVFVVRDGESSLIMENVVSVRPEGNTILLVDLFGEQKIITARIERVDLLKHEITLSTGESE
jgi:predicted RNA-binding protein